MPKIHNPKDTGARFSWTQPICGACYQKITGRIAEYAYFQSETEKCCACGETTREGIYYRINPASVAFPTRLK